MSSINSVRKLQILYFSKKNKKIKNLKNGEKKWPDIGIYTIHTTTAILKCVNYQFPKIYLLYRHNER